MKYFETDNEEIIKLYNDYRWLKYYKSEVLNDIQTQYDNYDFLSTGLSQEQAEDKIFKNIYSYLNKTEYKYYLQIIENHTDLGNKYSKYINWYARADKIDQLVDTCFIKFTIRMIKYEILHLFGRKRKYIEY